MEADLASSILLESELVTLFGDSHCTRLLTVCQTRCSSWSDYQVGTGVCLLDFLPCGSLSR
nr:MAG TPA: hypothetical protein [Caudoviricetes sp.]